MKLTSFFCGLFFIVIATFSTKGFSDFLREEENSTFSQKEKVFGESCYNGDAEARILRDGSILLKGSVWSGGIVRNWHQFFVGEQEEKRLIFDSPTKALIASEAAFAARLENGKVFVWGNPDNGGDWGGRWMFLPDGLHATTLMSTFQNLVALLNNGEVVATGEMLLIVASSYNGTDLKVELNPKIKELLTNLSQKKYSSEGNVIKAQLQSTRKLAITFSQGKEIVWSWYYPNNNETIFYEQREPTLN